LSESRRSLHAWLVGAIALGTLAAIVAPSFILALPLECVLRQATGLLCPFCGMTRDFTAMLHGAWPGENLFSLPFAAAVWVAYPAAAIRSISTGSAFEFSDSVRWALVAALGVMIVVNNF
jgi:hypothetical protein